MFYYVRVAAASRSSVIKRQRTTWFASTNKRTAAYPSWPKHISWRTTPLSGHTWTTASLYVETPTRKLKESLAELLTRCLRTISGSHASTVSRDTFDSYNIWDFFTKVFINNALTLFVQFHLSTEHRVFNPVTLTSSCYTRASSSKKTFTN